MNRTLIRLTIAAVTLAMAACLSACSRSDQKSGSPAARITLATPPAADSVLAVIAQAQGYFRQEGLEVALHTHPYGKLALKEALKGDADFAIVAETPVMFEVMNGVQVSIIATIQTSSRDNAVVARRDRGIRTARDLKGKRLAVTLGTTADYFTSSFLAVQGIARKAVNTVDLKADEIPAALADGSVDAASLFNPYIIQAQTKLGGRGITFFGEHLYTSSFNVAATREFIRRNPETVRKMLLALIRAEDFVRQNPGEAKKIVADAGRLDMDVLEKLWSQTTFRVALDQPLLLALEDESRWAIKEGRSGAGQVPNYLDFIYADGLQAVRPEAVRILR